MGADLWEQYDAVVVGGGAAGLAGAVALARMRRSVLVVDAGAPRNAPAAGVHNLLGAEGITPAELVAVGRREVEAYGGVVVPGRVSSLLPLGDVAGPHPRFAVALDDGRTTTARRLLLAAGAVDELPTVPGLADGWGTRVLHCPYCHGWEVRDQRIAVLSTGPMTAHVAGLWRQVSDDVVVLTHTGPALDGAARDGLAARGLRFVEGEVVAADTTGDGVRLRLASGEELERDAVAVTTSVRVDERLTGLLGVEVVPVEVAGSVPGTRVVADPTGATGVPGVYAAGNLVNPMAVVVAAAAGGQMAGAALNGDLVAEDVAAALAAVGAAARTAGAGR